MIVSACLQLLKVNNAHLPNLGVSPKVFNKADGHIKRISIDSICV